jgi:hypothetical protein
MPETPTIEQRLQKLESDMAELKRLNGERKTDWFSAVAGSFKDDPEFAEIVRLGREIRQADRPRDDQ